MSPQRGTKSYNIKLMGHKGKLEIHDKNLSETLSVRYADLFEKNDETLPASLFGCYIDRISSIFLDAEINRQPSQLSETLLHEIIEAGNQKLDLEMSHTQIQAIACFLNNVLLDNKIVRDIII